MVAKKCRVCTDTCSFPRNGSKSVKKCYEKKQCKENKNYACVCKSGYYLNDKNKCVKRKDCNKDQGTTKKPTTTTDKCKKNEIWKSCRSACEPNCEDASRAPKPCVKMCRPPGCECQPNYVRNDETNECVKPSQCPKTTTPLPPTTGKCKKNEHFTLCGSACEPRCSNYDKKKNWCNFQCLIGCQCRNGFVRNDYTNECIPSSECPVITTLRPPTQQCDVNSTFTMCTSPCQDVCSKAPIKVCTRNCGPPGCECLRNYVKNDVGGDGKCILRKDCPVATTSRPGTTPRCPKNMIYTNCKSACPSRCEIPRNVTSVCTFECAGEGCECREPFALDESNNCVRREECKKPSKGGYYIIHMLRKTVTTMYTLIFRR
uniref:TIL domain-containing protein n=1 Tax=Strongyloides papillosus TaxID=174720 RepID=A0A0N5CCU6_STREA